MAWMSLAMMWQACARSDSNNNDDGASTASPASSATAVASGSGTTSTSGSGGSGAGGAGGAALGGQGGALLDCATVCDTLFACATTGGACMLTDPDDRTLFMNGGVADGCLDQCAAQPALAQLVDGSDCPGTVADLEAASDDFACVCEHGVTGPDLLDCLGSGGGGGAGGS
jgi:hypothetical protein